MVASVGRRRAGWDDYGKEEEADGLDELEEVLLRRRKVEVKRLNGDAILI